MPAGFAHRFALSVSHAPAARLSEKLKKTLNAYHNRAISTMQVIEELIKLAKDRGKCRMTNSECRMAGTP